MELWSDLLPPLLEKYGALHRERLAALVPDDLASETLRRYDALCLEMVEGLHTLFMEMIYNQSYVRKQFPRAEYDIYREAHIGMVEALRECLAEEVATFMEFAYRLQGVVQQLRGYCVVLRQDIKRALLARPGLQKDRKFRQINLQAQRTLEAIDLHLARAKHFSESIAAGQLEQALEVVGKWEADPAGMQSWMEGLHFTEEERRILREVMEGDG